MSPHAPLLEVVLLSVREAAASAQVSEQAIHAWMGTGLKRGAGRVRLPFLRHGGRRRIEAAALAAFVRGEPPFDGAHRPEAGFEDGSHDAKKRAAAAMRAMFPGGVPE